MDAYQGEGNGKDIESDMSSSSFITVFLLLPSITGYCDWVLIYVVFSDC